MTSGPSSFECEFGRDLYRLDRMCAGDPKLRQICDDYRGLYSDLLAHRKSDPSEPGYRQHLNDILQSLLGLKAEITTALNPKP